jgi:hypothetical protein
MDDTQLDIIKGYVKVLTEVESSDLLEYSINSVVDRVLLYLNHKQLDKKFERVVADVVVNTLDMYKNKGQQAISSMSDNGQSVSYFNAVRNHFNTTSDKELFGGAVALLSRYRRATCVNTSKTYKSN